MGSVPRARSALISGLLNGEAAPLDRGRTAGDRSPAGQQPGASPEQHDPAPRQDRLEGALHRRAARRPLRPARPGQPERHLRQRRARARARCWLKHGDEIALGSTRARFDDGSGVALPLPPVGPGAIQNAIPLVAHCERDGAPFAAGHGGSAERPAAGAPAGVLARRWCRAPCPRRPKRRRPLPWLRRPLAAAPAGSAAAPAQPRRHARRRARRGARHRHADRRADQGLPPVRGHRGTTRSSSALDYERLRITWELTRDIGLERELDVCSTRSCWRSSSSRTPTAASFSSATSDGTLHPRAARRRDGTTTRHPGQLDDPEPRDQRARGRAHARRVDGLRRLEGQDR